MTRRASCRGRAPPPPPWIFGGGGDRRAWTCRFRKGLQGFRRLPHAGRYRAAQPPLVKHGDCFRCLIEGKTSGGSGARSDALHRLFFRTVARRLRRRAKGAGAAPSSDAWLAHPEATRQRDASSGKQPCGSWTGGVAACATLLPRPSWLCGTRSRSLAVALPGAAMLAAAGSRYSRRGVRRQASRGSRPSPA